MIKFISYSRSFNLTSLNTYGLYPFAYLYDKIGQEPYLYPNVFNFYRPDFQPLGEILNNNLEAPEFQPFTDVTAVGLPNSIRWLIYQGIRRDSNDTGIGQRWYSQGNLDLSYEISIAYNLNKSDLGFFGNYLDQLTVQVTGRNLFTFTNYSGWDPEVAISTNPTNFRLDEYSYPNFRSFSAAITLKF